jgi:hypothetical protein
MYLLLQKMNNKYNVNKYFIFFFPFFKIIYSLSTHGRLFICSILRFLIFRNLDNWWAFWGTHGSLVKSCVPGSLDKKGVEGVICYYAKGCDCIFFRLFLSNEPGTVFCSQYWPVLRMTVLPVCIVLPGEEPRGVPGEGQIIWVGLNKIAASF